MPRLPVRIVTLAELREVFNDLGLWDQIRSGELSTEPIPRRSVPASNPRYAGDREGNHICTTHQIVAADGTTILHWDESDVTLESEILVKAHE